MNKVVISGRIIHKEETLKWKKYFEKLDYNVINYPHKSNKDITDIYTCYYKCISESNIFFLMNVDGYIGKSMFSELMYAVMMNKVFNKKIKIVILNEPTEEEVISFIKSFDIELFYENMFDKEI